MSSPVEPDSIRVWCRLTHTDDYERQRTALSHDELAHCDRFYFDRDRRDYANAHDLLRRMLSGGTDTPPEQWRFESGSYGKPFLVSSSPDGEDPARVTFNLSHTRQFVACVIGGGVPVGIDIERATRLEDVLGLATRFFSPSETSTLRACVHENDRTRRFLELWTLKESFIKAIGKGLSQPLDSFSFDVCDEGRIAFTPPPEFAERGWQFAQYEVAPGVLMAVTACSDRALPFLTRLIDRDSVTDLQPYRTGHMAPRPVGPRL